MSQDALPIDDVSVHFLGDQAILFDRRRQRFYGANASAAFIWSCLEDGLTPDRIVDILAREHGIDPDLARHSVADVIHQWQSDRAFDDGGFAIPPAPSAIERPVFEAGEMAPLAATFQTRQYRLLDSAFIIRFETAGLLRIVDGLFAHLAVETRPAHGIVFDLIVHNGGFAVRERGQILEWCASRDGVAVMTKICIIRRALEQSRDFCAVHAGLVSRGGACLLLPGESGAGKSTLVAGLAAAGFTVWGDDTAVLAAGTLLARPVPCGIGLKPGSWPIVAAHGFPHIARAPIHARPDGKRVRYLRSQDYIAAEVADTAPVGWIVFPRFDADVRTGLRELGKADALRRLLPGFVRLGDDLDAADVAGLVRWIDGIACYDLHLSSLNEAVGIVEELLS